MLTSHLCLITRAAAIPVNLISWLNLLQQNNWGLLIVDDGCSTKLAQQLDQLSLQNHFHIIRILNQGDIGIAMRVGMDEAQQLGYSHALWLPYPFPLQSDLFALINQQLLLQPEALGFSTHQNALTFWHKLVMPIKRLLGEQFYHLHTTPWLRLYPLATFNALLSNIHCARGYEYDYESLLHWQWQNYPCNPLIINQQNKKIKRTWSLTVFGRYCAMLLRLSCGRLLRLPSLWPHKK